MSKHQIRPGDGRWEGRRGVGRLNPRRETKTKGRNGDREREMKEEVTDKRNFWRANGDSEAEQSGAFYDSAKGGIEHEHVDGKSQLPYTTYGPVNGKHGVGRALDVLSVYDGLGCDVIGLQETRRSGHSAFSQAGYLVYCSGEYGNENGGKKGQGGVGLVVRTSITRAARPPEFISDRLLKVALELRGRAKAVTFFVAYAPTEIHDAASKKHAFGTTLDRAVKDVLRHEQLFVLMDANARTGRREKGGVGSQDSKILGAYGRDTFNDNRELLPSFTNNHDLAIVNTFFSTPKGGVSHIFNGRGKKRIDYILTRQRDRKLVRNVTVHTHPTLCPHPSSSSPILLGTAG